MSEAVLYQSVLQKLGQLSPQKLVELDVFLAFLVQKQNKGIGSIANGTAPLDQYFGAWEDWDDDEFQSFLKHTTEVRNDLFFMREVDL
jgi:hypothetical protein